jgi:hypothetical protein
MDMNRGLALTINALPQAQRQMSKGRYYVRSCDKCAYCGRAAHAGTGKFQGLQASVAITSMPVKSTYEGAFQIVGHKNGAYKIVKTN